MLSKYYQKIKNNRAGAAILSFLSNKYLIILVLFALWIVFFDSNNLIDWYKNLTKVSDQNKQKQYYKEAIVRKEEQLKELDSNRDSLERFAREQFLFHEEGEDVFVLK